MPILLAGHGGGRADRPRARLSATAATTTAAACSLYLSLMDRMGVRLAQFGDSDRRLEDLNV